jgi:hypothetical protein
MHHLQALACLLMMHCSCISTGMEQVSKYTKYGLHVRRFCDSDTKLATPNFLRRQKKSSAFGSEPKRPRIWAFLAEGF